MPWGRVDRGGNTNDVGAHLENNEKCKTILKYKKIYYIENGGQLLSIPNEIQGRKLA